MRSEKMESNEQTKRQDEMIKRVLEVADYAIETGASTRQISKHFKEHRFPISNCTVSVYLNERLKEIDPRRYQLVKPLIEKNTPKTVESVEVRKRMYSAVSLLLRGLNISQIVEEMNKTREEKVTFDIIYDDLTNRLKRLEKDSKIIEDVKKRLSENRIDNLNNQNNNGPNLKAINQPRAKNGTFTSNESIEGVKKR